MPTYFWVCLILFLGGFTHGLAGFGAVVVSIPLLAIFLDVKVVIPLAALAGLIMPIIVILPIRAQFQWAMLKPLLVGALPGVVVGVALLKRLESSAIHWFLGVILIAYSLYDLFWRSEDRDLHRAWAYPFGFLAGCFGGAFSAAGPPVVVYASLRSWNKDQFKATLQGFFFVSGTMVVISHALSGITSYYVLRLFVVAVPALIIGTFMGSLLYGAVREVTYRRIVLTLLACLGVLMIMRA